VRIKTVRTENCTVTTVYSQHKDNDSNKIIAV